MFFKNLIIYRSSRPFNLSQTELERLLSELTFTPCGSQDLAKFGWVSPLGKRSESLAHEADGQMLLCAKREEKIIPTSVINDELSAKVDEIEESQGSPLNRKEKAALRDDVIMDLLPRAFSRYQQTYVWINVKENFIAIDSGSHGRAEDVLALLRKSIGSLPVVALNIATPPVLTMTKWLKDGEAWAGFSIEDKAELTAALEHGGTIRARDQDLLSDEIKAHLDADKLVTSLALDWTDSISFTLKDDLSIKQIKFSEELRGQNDDVTTEDPAARFDADFALVTGELSRFIPDLIAALGGEDSRTIRFK